MENKEIGIGQAVDAAQGKQIDPKLQSEINTYVTAAMTAMHDDRTNGSIVKMLQSAPAEKSVPEAAGHVASMINTAFENKGKKPSNAARLAGYIYITNDLVELGVASGHLKEAPTPEAFQQILTEGLKREIHKGLKDGSLDPVQLQAETEPLLSEQQMQVGATVAGQLGLPTKPTTEMGMDAYVQKKMRPLKEENKILKSKMGGM